MQTVVTIHVLQGERPMAADNTSLGRFNLEGIPPAPRGIPKIDVTFDIDANGILNVTARDTATGRSQSIRITGSTRLSPGEKERMIAEAERYAEEDRKRREAAEALNDAHAVCYQAERTLAEFGDKLDPGLRERLEAAVRDTKEAVQARDVEAAKRRAEDLKTIVQEAGSALYAAAAATPPPETPSGASAGTEGRRVVNAQYEEV